MTRPDEWVVETVQRVASRLESQGVPVAYVDGWQNRGRPWAFNPRGLVIHHTATRGYEYDYASLGIVRDGRSDLPGPLAQFGLGRHTGTVYVIASGYANHAGEGGWNGLSGNGSVWGVEAENDGIGEPWNPLALRSYVLLAVALCIEGGFGPESISCHREWSPYKIDPTGIDGNQFRADVAEGGTEDDELTQEERDTLKWCQEMIGKLVGGLDPDWFTAAGKANAVLKAGPGKGGVTLEQVRADLVKRLQ